MKTNELSQDLQGLLNKHSLHDLTMALTDGIRDNPDAQAELAITAVLTMPVDDRVRFLAQMIILLPEDKRATLLPHMEIAAEVQEEFESVWNHPMKSKADH